MIMLRSSINRETREVLFRNLCHEFGGDFPDRFFSGRSDRNRGSLRPMPIMARVLDPGYVDVLLQCVQRFCNQGGDGLACLLGKRGKQIFLFRRQMKRIRFHGLTIPKAPCICKEWL